LNLLWLPSWLSADRSGTFTTCSLRLWTGFFLDIFCLIHPFISFVFDFPDRWHEVCYKVSWWRTTWTFLVCRATSSIVSFSHTLHAYGSFWQKSTFTFALLEFIIHPSLLMYQQPSPCNLLPWTPGKLLMVSQKQFAVRHQQIHLVSHNTYKYIRIDREILEWGFCGFLVCLKKYLFNIQVK